MVRLPAPATPSSRLSRVEIHEGQIVDQMTSDQEIPSDMLTAGTAHPLDQHRIVQQMADAKGDALFGPDEKPRHAVDDLRTNSSGFAPDHGLAFPHRLRDDDAEP